MPHLFVNRPRLHNLTKDRTDLRSQFRWETINAVLYKAGGLVFIMGSILFFPALSAYADLGAWTFFFGSLLYLVVTGHDLMEVRHHWRKASKQGPERDSEKRQDYIAAFSYLGGTVLFTVGSILFLSYVAMATPGAWCFVIGSLLFVVGSCVNVLQIITSDSIITLQLMNLTAVAFVMGSVLFTVASIPYLWTVSTPAYRATLHGFLAWQYLVGSVLFFLGGVFNYWRAYVVMKQALQTEREGF